MLNQQNEIVTSLLSLQYLDYYDIEQYLDKEDASVFVIKFEHNGSLKAVKIFHFDSSLNISYYNAEEVVRFAKLRGIYDSAHNESHVIIESDAFTFTEEELAAISSKFKRCRNFYDIEPLIATTILANYKRFAYHEKLAESIAKQTCNS